MELNGSTQVDELGWDTERFGKLEAHAACIPVFSADLEARADETIRLWIASRKTEFPLGTIPRCDLLGVSVAG